MIKINLVPTTKKEHSDKGKTRKRTFSDFTSDTKATTTGSASHDASSTSVQLAYLVQMAKQMKCLISMWMHVDFAVHMTTLVFLNVAAFADTKVET